MISNRNQGFTLLELVLVLGLVGIVVSFTTNVGLDSLARSNVVQERDLFVSLVLKGVRAKAMANVDEINHGVHIDSDGKQYVLFRGDSYSPNRPDNRVIPFVNPKTVITTESGSEEIIFKQLSGDVIGATKISFNNGAAEQVVKINSLGQISW